VKLTHMYSGSDGRSHFEDREVTLSPSALGSTSAFIAAESICFRDTGDAPVAAGFHPAPRRQLVFMLAGRVEYECGDGARCVFGPGDILLADDTAGQGHRARVLEGPRLQVFVPLRAEVALDTWTTAAPTA
jgi:hypothetical protein